MYVETLVIFQTKLERFQLKTKKAFLSVKQGSLVLSELSIFYASYSISTVILQTQLRYSFFGLKPYVKTLAKIRSSQLACFFLLQEAQVRSPDQHRPRRQVGVEELQQVRRSAGGRRRGSR